MGRKGRISRASLMRTHGLIVKLLAQWDGGSRFAQIQHVTRFTSVPDGYPTNSLSTGSVNSGSEADPTLGAVMGRGTYEQGDHGGVWADKPGQPDPVDEYCRTIERAQARAYDALTEMERAWQLMGNIGVPDPLGICMACGRMVARTPRDPLRSGMCTECDQALRRERRDGPVDRADFCRRRRERREQREVSESGAKR